MKLTTPSVPTQRRMKLDELNYVVIKEFLFHIITQEKLTNIMLNILLIV